MAPKITQKLFKSLQCHCAIFLRLAKLERTKKDDFRTTLKSSGHKHDKIEEEEAPAEGM